MISVMSLLLGFAIRIGEVKSIAIPWMEAMDMRFDMVEQGKVLGRVASRYVQNRFMILLKNGKIWKLMTS